MGFVKIWVHIVWTTKNQQKLLTKEVRKEVFTHIRENAISKGIYVDFINGYLEQDKPLIKS